ncbi:sensor domain-containing diguanylate cyclase [Tsuneonella sp. SYSU-LHT278]|uniref:sensor domain-containing diguanylate cyclase n=1 Tax=Tsuneonella sediminis TaxID=3416089 RepID=UPI003F7A8C0D
MGRLGFWIALIVAALLGALAPSNALAAPTAAPCSATSSDRVPIARTLAEPLDWRCPGRWDHVSHSRQLVLLKFDPSRPPRFVVSRAVAFDSISVAWQTPGGANGSLVRPFDRLKPTFLDRRFVLPLPELPPGTDRIVVGIDGATNALPLEYMTLARQKPGTTTSERDALLIAAFLLGLLAMPLCFDVVFYRVLREPFILWHMAFVAGMALQIYMTAGLYLPSFDLGLRAVRAITVGGFGLMVAGALMFFVAFVEKGTLGRREVAALRIGAVWMAAVCAFHAAGFTAFGTLSSQLLYVSGIPVAMIFAWSAWTAHKAGSRMVRFIAIGFAPLLAIVILRMVTFLLPSVPTLEANGLFQAGMVIEIGATALGVAARFLALRDERDRAQSEARDLEDLVERDPLTGLLNRRAVEPRFADLRQTGYETFALIDLDNFKSVNDRHGHAVGDAVLVATAEVLASEPDCVAVRLGGEEFLLLLHGPDADQRAERVRRAIPRRVAREIEGLAAPVTASMGVVVAPHAALPRVRFGDLYVMADKLLYEAKEAGRNRTFSEKVRAFRKPRGERRRAA